MNHPLPTATLLTAMATADMAVAASGYGLPLLHITTADGVVLAAERNERTLYVPEKGRPHCGADCSLDWPPFRVHPNDFPSDGLEVLHRPDGTRQWSLGDRPLYFFIGDLRRGDANGDGIGGWRALRPDELTVRPRREPERSAGESEVL